MDQVHTLYVRHLHRTCELDVVRRLASKDLSQNFLDRLAAELVASDEAAIVTRMRNALCDRDSAVDAVIDLYMRLLDRLPSNHEMLKALSDKTLGLAAALNETSDGRYLSRCRATLPAKTKAVAVPDGAVGIKYCFALGTSGIARVGRDLVRSLSLVPDACRVELECIQFHNFDDHIDDDIVDAFSCSLDRYEYVVVHCLPEFIPVVAKRERAKNPDVLVYAIVAWETDRLPFEWLPWLQHADKISCPSTFNTIAFRREGNLLPPVEVVHHPTVTPIRNAEDVASCPIHKLKSAAGPGSFVFYNISEWSNRKGITELIDAFAEAFRDDSSTWLYLKVSGDTPEGEGRAYVKRMGLVNVVLDYARVSDGYIDCLHTCGDCFVSMTKAEGHFIGACQAHLMGRPVIVTGASGHLDYLDASDPSVHLIPVHAQPATFCSTVAAKHRACAIMPHCAYFTRFVPCQMQWFKADPVAAVTLMRRVRRQTPVVVARPSNKFTVDVVGPRLLESILSTAKFADRSKALATSLSVDFLRRYQWQVYEPAGPSVLLINAGAYGNVGDHLYNKVIVAQTANTKLRLSCITDNEAVIVEGDKACVVSCVDERAFRAGGRGMQHFDAIVIGGGGLLSRERLGPRSNLLAYGAWAHERGIPLYLLSVGFQDISFKETGDLNGISVADGYQSLLETAQYVSVRSLIDYALCIRVLNYSDVSKVHHHPDLVYGLYEEIADAREPRDTVLVLYPEASTRFLEVKFPVPRGGRIIFANFGGNAGLAHRRAKLDEIQCAVREAYPDAIFYHGMDAPANRSPGATLFSLDEMFATMRRSSYVYTVRHHGYILARLHQVPTIVLGDASNYKTRCDVHETTSRSLMSTIEHSRGGLKSVSAMISDGVHLNYRNWTNDDRNSAIVSLAKLSGQSVGMVQSLVNRDIQLGGRGLILES